MAGETTTVKKRVYSEGASNLRVFKRNRLTNTYDAAGYTVEGLVNINITLSQTKDKKAADNKTNYLVRIAPASGEGTIQLMGLSRNDYLALYSDLTDKNGIINFGSTAEPQSLGIMYDEIEGYVDATGVSHTSTNRMVIYDCEFSLPPLSAATLDEGTTETRDYSISVTCSSIENKGRQSIAALINSVDNPVQFEATNSAMYVLPADDDVVL